MKLSSIKHLFCKRNKLAKKYKAVIKITTYCQCCGKITKEEVIDAN